MKINDKLLFLPNKPARNRILMPPMDTLMAKNGYANDFHIQHYGSRAYGGVGTIVVESTAVSIEGRIRIKDLGLWEDEQIEPLAKVVNVVKTAGALVGLQLNHAGSKAELDIPTKGATKFYESYLSTKLSLVTPNDLKTIENQFVQAAKRAKKAGFDFVEIHGAHGYLLNQLLNPYLNEVNKSSDILERASIIINIVKRIYEEVQIPVGIRFSFEDHIEPGMKTKDFKPLLEKLEPYVIYYNVSSGETLGRFDVAAEIEKAGTYLFRIPIAKKVKALTSKPVFTVGNVSSREDVNKILKSNIDGILIGRELLFNPNLVVNKLLKPEEIEQDLYHWNDNLWYNHHDYAALKKKLGHD